jgi:hypothetical protein
VTDFELHDSQSAAVQIAKIKGAYAQAEGDALAQGFQMIVDTGIFTHDATRITHTESPSLSAGPGSKNTP